MARGSRPAAFRSAIQPCKTACETAATGVPPFARRLSDGEAQLIDVFGQLFLQRERHRPREFDAAARRQLRLGQQNLGRRRERHHLAGARHRRGQGQGAALTGRRRIGCLVDHQPFGLVLAGCGEAQQ